MANSNRVRAGVPAGGEFASAPRSENDDLPTSVPGALPFNRAAEFNDPRCACVGEIPAEQNDEDVDTDADFQIRWVEQNRHWPDFNPDCPLHGSMSKATKESR